MGGKEPQIIQHKVRFFVPGKPRVDGVPDSYHANSKMLKIVQQEAFELFLNDFGEIFTKPFKKSVNYGHRNLPYGHRNCTEARSKCVLC